MAAQHYKNAQGVVITAQLVEDEAHEHYGLYRVTDKDGNVGHISAAQLQDNYAPVPAQPAPTKG